ncbi:hypothetical protein COP2_009651 [Malus domestica]
MSDYLNSLKEISNKLAAAGEPIFESDLVAYTLSGLSDDYESFIYSIEMRTESVNTDELHGMLLSKEISLQKRKTRASLSITPFHVFAAQRGSNYYKGNSRGRFQNRNRFPHNCNSGANQFRNFGANQNRNHNNSRSILGPGPGATNNVHNFGQSGANTINYSSSQSSLLSG